MNTREVLVSVITPAIVVAIVTFIACGLLVSFSFATSHWYVALLGAIVGGAAVWIIRSTRGKHTKHRHRASI